MQTSTPPRQRHQKVMVPGIATIIYCTLGLLLYLSTQGSYKLKRCYALYVQYAIVGSKGLKMIKGWKCAGNQMTESSSELIALKETHQFESTTNLKCMKITYSTASKITESGKLN
jgi:hypothetical protein